MTRKDPMLDAHDHRPLYIQLVDALLCYIVEECSTDDKLPTEKELCEEYAVSRTTVRLALNELEQRGRIYRVQGKGSFVSAPVAEGHNTLLSYDLGPHCGEPEQEALESELVSVSRSVGDLALLQLFGTHRREQVVKAELWHRMNGALVASESLYLSAERVHVGAIERPEDISRALFSLQGAIGSVRERYEARPLTSSEQGDMQASSASVMLVVTKFAYGATGELLYLLERHLLTDRITYQNFVFTSWE